MLGLLPHHFPRLKTIKISNNPENITALAFWKLWVLTSQEGHNPRSAIYCSSHMLASLLTSLHLPFLVYKMGRILPSSPACEH
jgi:hypothetical protein